jgi:hypothetical protein
MDLKLYYQKVRDTASKIADPFPVVVSKESTDGGKDGIFTEVTRSIAAKMLVEGLVRLATLAEAEAFRLLQAEAKRAADQVAAMARVQLAVLSTDELNSLKGMSQPSRD